MNDNSVVILYFFIINSILVLLIFTIFIDNVKYNQLLYMYIFF